MKIFILVAIWFAGIATAGIALFNPQYVQYVVIGAAGWTTVIVSTGLILFEIRRIRAEDKKKELV